MALTSMSIASDLSGRRKNPLDAVPVEEMLRWCDEEPTARYPAMSHVVSYYSVPKDGGAEWAPLAMEMLKRAPDPLAILETFVGRFRPTSWSGSRAAIIESRLGLLERLDELKNAFLTDYAVRIRPQLLDEIAKTRRWENERDSARDETFE
jgi:hypothetical protein